MLAIGGGLTGGGPAGGGWRGGGSYPPHAGGRLRPRTDLCQAAAVGQLMVQLLYVAAAMGYRHWLSPAALVWVGAAGAVPRQFSNVSAVQAAYGSSRMPQTGLTMKLRGVGGHMNTL